jgi:hypothetical protein
MIEKLKEFSDFIFIIFVVNWVINLILMSILVSIIPNLATKKLVILCVGIFNALFGLFVYHIIQQKEEEENKVLRAKRGR